MLSKLLDHATKRINRLLDENDKQAAEIERLRELVTLREKQLDTHIAALLKDEDEIERLREENLKLQDKFDDLNGANILNANALKLALEKVNRLQKILRSGLHKHTNYPGVYMALHSEPGLFAYWEYVKEELGEEDD